jgi:hypothetical protein
MNDSLALQYAIVAVIVVGAAASVLRKYLPSVWGRALARVADGFESARMPAFVRRLGARLRARIPASVGSNCASSGSCSSCGACATADTTPVPIALNDPKPLRRA